MGSIKISEKQAVESARKVAEENNWLWVDPAEAVWHSAWVGSSGKWEVFSNSFKHGAKVRVVIESPSGKILEKGYLPR